MKDEIGSVRRGAGVFVHRKAYVAGDVALGENASIWCGACLRGDIAPIRVGKNSNVQDNATIHVGYGLPTVLGENVTVGHNAVVHGCTIGNNVIVGMGSVILDGAVIGDDCIIGAATLVPQRKEIPSGSLVFGNPFRVVRPLTDQEKQSIRANALEYCRLAQIYKEAEGEQ